MAKTDWSLNNTVQPQDMNAIGEEINQLREDVEHIEIPPASVTEAGIVKLSNATNSTNETLAATPRAVKSAYDAATAAQTTANAANTAVATAQARADSAFQLGNERKAEVVAALVALGVQASTSDTWAQLISKMASVIRATGNATAGDLLAGKTASNASGPFTGSMPNRGAGGTVTPGTANQTKLAGYYSDPITILGDADLVPENIRSGVNIFGIVGALPVRQLQLINASVPAKSQIFFDCEFPPGIVIGKIMGISAMAYTSASKASGGIGDFFARDGGAGSGANFTNAGPNQIRIFNDNVYDQSFNGLVLRI